MKCPRCKADSTVIDSRDAASGTVVRRRRECQKCRFRWSTHEIRIDMPNLKIPLEQRVRVRNALDQIEPALDKALSAMESIRHEIFPP